MVALAKVQDDTIASFSIVGGLVGAQVRLQVRQDSNDILANDDLQDCLLGPSNNKQMIGKASAIYKELPTNSKKSWSILTDSNSSSATSHKHSASGQILGGLQPR